MIASGFGKLVFTRRLNELEFASRLVNLIYTSRSGEKLYTSKTEKTVYANKFGEIVYVSRSDELVFAGVRQQIMIASRFGEDDKTLALPRQLRKENVQDESVEPLVQAMIGAFQCVTGSKEFSGVRETDPTKVEYWLEGVEKIFEQMACTEDERLGCTLSLLTYETHP
ncbi:E3 ubiquitin-protein ligase COP1-like [Gossypium australe]|uniref:E3 ubiquitin-protein ligase COP1-like n=1 Tax=Gossypium australe TaxID=47621 RepID=A0A5B6ULW8_9ROSI|nr:E3 ubiquitin-protein ligase COP1-like [Gossypium australe]